MLLVYLQKSKKQVENNSEIELLNSFNDRLYLTETPEQLSTEVDNLSKVLSEMESLSLEWYTWDSGDVHKIVIKDFQKIVIWGVSREVVNARDLDITGYQKLKKSLMNMLLTSKFKNRWWKNLTQKHIYICLSSNRHMLE